MRFLALTLLATSACFVWELATAQRLPWLITDVLILAVNGGWLVAMRRAGFR